MESLGLRSSESQYLRNGQIPFDSPMLSSTAKFGLGPCFFAGFHAVALQKLQRKIPIGLGAAGTWVVQRDRLAVAGSLCQPDIARDGRLEQLVLEEILQIVADLLGQVGAVVKHGQQHALNGKLGVEAGRYAIERRHELGDALQREILSLHGDEQGIGGDQGVEGQQVERRRAIEEDKGIVISCGLEGFAQAMFAALDAHQLHIRANHVLCARNQRQIWARRWAQ